MIRRIEREPDRFPTFHFGTRRATLRRFPYLVVFREVATRVEIIAVAHGRRRPSYWQESDSARGEMDGQVLTGVRRPS